MSVTSDPYPAWPPGFWRRIVLHPGPGWIGGALEDDVHRFHLRIDHSGGRITAVRAEALRHPWSACPGAAPHLALELTAELLTDVAQRDPAQHCTHLFDLAVLCAAHAADAEPSVFDMRVADRVAGRTTATLAIGGTQVIHWLLADTAIYGAEPWGGRDLRQLSKWKHELPPSLAEQAAVLRRALFVSGVRNHVVPADQQLAFQGSQRMGVCFNYQLPQAATSVRTPDWTTDFSASGTEPLAGFDGTAAFAAMAV